jgi:hypothetical protein
VTARPGRRRTTWVRAKLREAADSGHTVRGRFLYAEAIDITTYGRQRDKLREELTLAKVESRQAVQELDVEGILAFRRSHPAARVRPVGPGVGRIRAAVTDLFFPEGIAYDGSNRSRSITEGRSP